MPYIYLVLKIKKVKFHKLLSDTYVLCAGGMAEDHLSAIREPEDDSLASLPMWTIMQSPNKAELKTKPYILTNVCTHECEY